MLILLIVLAILFLAAIYLLFMPITVYVNIQIDNETTTLSGVKVFPFEHRFKPEKPGPIKMKKVKAKKPEPPKKI